MERNERNVEPDSTLKKIGKLFGQIGWNKKFTELDEQDVLYLVMSIQQMEKLEDANELVETYLAAIWLKFNIEDKNAEFPFGRNVKRFRKQLMNLSKRRTKVRKDEHILVRLLWENRVLVEYNIDLWVKNLIRKVSSVLSFYVYSNLDIRLRTWHMVGWLRQVLI